MITQQDRLFYEQCRNAKSVKKMGWTKHYGTETYKYNPGKVVEVNQKFGMKVFSGRLNNLSRKYPIVFNDIVQSVYDRHMDIMYLYEMFIAQKNHCSLEQATQIATLKRHSRHNYDNINQIDIQKESYDLPDDY